MIAIVEHELGHALGLDHSNDPRDIMYPSNEEIDNTNLFLESKYGSLLLITFYTAIAITVFISVSWLLNRKKDKHLRMNILIQGFSTIQSLNLLAKIT